jgi:hypothetical protein
MTDGFRSMFGHLIEAMQNTACRALDPRFEVSSLTAMAAAFVCRLRHLSLRFAPRQTPQPFPS